jgi:hypothetical protein
LRDTGGGGGGGTCILVKFLSTFSTLGIEEEGGGGSDDNGTDSFLTSGCGIGFVAFTGVETSISSSTSGTANIFLGGRYFIQNDMILFTRLIFFASSSFSPFSRSLLFQLNKAFP